MSTRPLGFPRYITRYGDELLWFSRHTREEVTAFLTQLQTPDGLVTVAVEEPGNSLRHILLPLLEAIEFTIAQTVDRNVVVYVDPMVGISMRLPFEEQPVPYGLTREELDIVLEELDITPSLVAEGTNDLSVIFLLKDVTSPADGQALQSSLVNAIENLSRTLERTVKVEFDQDRLVRIPGTLHHMGSQVGYVTFGPSTGKIFTANELLTNLNFVEAK